tara:strand:+ start:184 stop:975 length:792 start_codon:yes stop_codon:yes gene_type:complete
MNYSKSNKEIIIITGAGQGIGKAIAKNLNDKYDLLLISKTSNCKKTAMEIKKTSTNNGLIKRKIEYQKINLENEVNFDLLKKKINFKKYKNLHLILCAGIVDPYIESYKKIKNWNKVFKINLFSNILFINFFSKFFKNKKKQSKIIVFSGGGAASSFEKFPIYSASKTALVRSVENFSQILFKKNVSIFAIAPGAIKTKMLKKVEKISKVGTRSHMVEVVNFINNCFKINTRPLNGKLIHIKDNLNKIKKNNDTNYLKLRRIQ